MTKRCISDKIDCNCDRNLQIPLKSPFVALLLKLKLTSGRPVSVLRHKVFWLSFAAFLVLDSLKTSNQTPTFTCYRLSFKALQLSHK